MKDANFLEEENGDATSFSFGYLGTKPDEESFDVLPGNVRTGWVSKDGFESLAVAALHEGMVPRAGTGVGSDA